MKGLTGNNLKKSESSACVLCTSSYKDVLCLGALLKVDDYHIHQYCLLFANILCNKIENVLTNVNKESIEAAITYGRDKECSYCNHSGATIICNYNDCDIKFHLTCGIMHQSLHQYFGEFRSFCVVHRPYQNIESFGVNRANKVECLFCLGKIVFSDPFTSIKSECCTNTWFHRSCVQRQSLKDGFRLECPSCSAVEEFQNGILIHGIHIVGLELNVLSESENFNDVNNVSCREEEKEVKSKQNFVKNSQESIFIKFNDEIHTKNLPRKWSNLTGSLFDNHQYSGRDNLIESFVSHLESDIISNSEVEKSKCIKDDCKELLISSKPISIRQDQLKDMSYSNFAEKDLTFHECLLDRNDVSANQRKKPLVIFSHENNSSKEKSKKFSRISSSPQINNETITNSKNRIKKESTDLKKMKKSKKIIIGNDKTLSPNMKFVVKKIGKTYDRISYLLKDKANTITEETRIQQMNNNQSENRMVDEEVDNLEALDQRNMELVIEEDSSNSNEDALPDDPVNYVRITHNYAISNENSCSESFEDDGRNMDDDDEISHTNNSVQSSGNEPDEISIESDQTIENDFINMCSDDEVNEEVPNYNNHDVNAKVVIPRPMQDEPTYQKTKRQRNEPLAKHWVIYSLDHENYEGLRWIQNLPGHFTIPWPRMGPYIAKEWWHLFIDYAVLKGETRPMTQELLKQFKRNFRCALNKAKTVTRITSIESRKDIQVFLMNRLAAERKEMAHRKFDYSSIIPKSGFSKLGFAKGAAISADKFAGKGQAVDLCYFDSSDESSKPAINNFETQVF